MRHESIDIPGYDGGRMHHAIKIGNLHVPIKLDHGDSGLNDAEELLRGLSKKRRKKAEVVFMEEGKAYPFTPDGWIEVHTHQQGHK